MKPLRLVLLLALWLLVYGWAVGWTSGFLVLGAFLVAIVVPVAWTLRRAETRARQRGWRVSASHPDVCYYHEYRGGAWCVLEFEALCDGDTYSVDLERPRAWDDKPAWACERRAEIAQRVASALRDQSSASERP